ncbi:hypothetical protein CHUAL_003734 [Chamberlinius hualienensis]
MANAGSPKRGIAWNYFKELSHFKAKCELCAVVLSLRGGTANLARHLRKKHEINYATLSRKLKTSPVIIAAIENHEESMIPVETDTLSQTTELEHQNVIEYAEVDAEQSEIEHQIEEQQVEHTATTPSRKRSHIWALFTQIQPNKVQCKICEHVQSSKGVSTGNMLRHVRLKHPEMIVEESATVDSISVSDCHKSENAIKSRLAEEQLNTDEVLVNLLKSRLSAPKKSPLDELSVEVRSFVITIGAKLQLVPAAKRNKLEAQIFALVSTALEEPAASEECQTEERK